jgi:hypothetical protein
MARKPSIADEDIGTSSKGGPAVSGRASTVDFCPRCSGLMVREWFYDFQGDMPFQGARCVMCGEILDSLILEHRTGKPKQRRLSLNRSRAYVRPRLI